MTNKWPITLGSLTAIVIAVVATLAVAGVFDSGSAASPGDGEQAETAALCVDGAEDCEDMIVITTADQGDLADEPSQGDDAGDLPISDVGETGSNDSGEPDEGEALAIEAASSALEAMDGPRDAEVEVSGIESVTWNNGCLGVETPGIACLQVITPGYIVFLSGAGGDYEFHTDTNGNAVFAPQD